MRDTSRTGADPHQPDGLLLNARYSRDIVDVLHRDDARPFIGRVFTCTNCTRARGGRQGGWARVFPSVRSKSPEDEWMSATDGKDRNNTA